MGDDSHRIDCHGKLQYSQTAGIRIKGGGSRGFAQKSLNLYAREEYDGNKKFKYDFFGTGYKAKKLSLFTGGDDNVSKSKDYFACTACEDVKVAKFHFVPYALFLNGEYWGMYWLTEKYDDTFIKKNYGVDDEIIMIKNGGVEEGTESDITLWTDMCSFISQNESNRTY